MKRSVGLIAAALLTVGWTAAAHARSGSYRVDRTFKVGGDGGWDYMTVDSARGLLFVPRSSHTLVLEAATGGIVADILGQKRNHGVALVPKAGRGFITDGEDGSVYVFDLKTYAVLGKVQTEPDADGVIYDPASGKVLAVSGDGGALYAISPDVDPKAGKPDSKVELGGKPEFLVSDGTGRVYVNLVDKDQVAVVDTKTMKVVARWPTAPGGSPVGMAIDPARRRLFIGCRKPQKLLVMGADDGKILAALPIGQGVDAVGFDESGAFASCKDGTLSVVRETSPGKFAVTQTVKTRLGARTLGVDARTHALYLPTAEFGEKLDSKGRPAPKPGSFMILRVSANP